MALANTSALSNGVLLPLVGFGCAGVVRRDTLRDALSLGYKLFDTAQVCGWDWYFASLAQPPVC